VRIVERRSKHMSYLSDKPSNAIKAAWREQERLCAHEREWQYIETRRYTRAELDALFINKIGQNTEHVPVKHPKP
jgi:hypothetical protein